MLATETIQLPGVSIVISAAVAILGLILYLAVKQRAELKEIGRIMFAFGLLAFLLLFK